MLWTWSQERDWSISKTSVFDVHHSIQYDEASGYTSCNKIANFFENISMICFLLEKVRRKTHYHQASALALTDAIHHGILPWSKYLAPEIKILNVLHDNFSFFQLLLCNIRAKHSFLKYQFLL